MARPISGSTMVTAIGAIVLTTVAGLVIYKQRPQMRTLPFTVQTTTGTMYLVPAGPTLHGADDTRAVVPAFYIDQTEVTNEQYGRFCRESGYKPPQDLASRKPEDPVTGVSIADATSFAKWAGKRLPDPIEWEKAARGSRGGKYPWGNAADPHRANVSDNPDLPGDGVLPADSMPQAASPARALHMVGNVAEFVRIAQPPDAAARSRYSSAANEPWYTIRGGSFRRTLAESAPWLSESVPMSYRAPDIGFRCAKDP